MEPHDSAIEQRRLRKHHTHRDQAPLADAVLVGLGG